MTNKNNPAFDTPSNFGLTTQEYAAIHLKVADSGTPWLDEMIEKSRRDEFAKLALQNRYTQAAGYSEDLITHHAYILARAMLAASKEPK